MAELLVILFIFTTIAILLCGYPVGLSLAGSSLIFALIGSMFGHFDMGITLDYPTRILGIMSNDTLIAVPLFIFMGMMLEKSKIAEKLLETMGLLFGSVKGGIGISIFIVGAFLAASTGIVGATVVTMGLISLPAMLKYKYRPSLAGGIVTASGTLGQIIPPSIILIILGDQISTAYQEALRIQGDFSGANVSIGELFFGALVPGFMLVVFYILYIVIVSIVSPQSAPAIPESDRRQVDRAMLLRQVMTSLLPPLVLIFIVLGSILFGIATATEAASTGCIGVMILAIIKKKFNMQIIKSVIRQTARVNSMVFLILIGANLFSLVFRGLGGDYMVENLLLGLHGGKWFAFFCVMLLIFILGFFLDFFEITFVVVPIVGPVLLASGFNPVWLGVMIAINLQTSFLTPPFGFALFYLKGVAPPELKTSQLYKGVIPFIAIQIIVMMILVIVPELVTALPAYMF